jgi:hypothetical protein
VHSESGEAIRANQRHPRFLKEEKNLDIFLPSQISSMLAKPGYEEAQ